MAEIKNNFLKGKMNQDLDERLLDEGEYREAHNVSVSNSDTGNSGSLENVRGNIKVTDFGLTDRGLEVIGTYVDTRNNRIFAFITNYNDSSPDTLSNFSSEYASHYIACYNVDSSQPIILVKGRFLNFSKTHPILSINSIENLLFWTDNRNQPRKINVDTAIGSSSEIDTDPHYFLEEHISVAKYYPYKPMRLHKKTPYGSGSLNTYAVNYADKVTTIPTTPVDGTYILGTYAGGGITPTVASGAQPFLQLKVIVQGGVITYIAPTQEKEGTGDPTVGYIPGGFSIVVGDTFTILAASIGASTDAVMTVTEDMLSNETTMFDVTTLDLPFNLKLPIDYNATSYKVKVNYSGSTASLEQMAYTNCYVVKPNGTYSLDPSAKAFVRTVTPIVAPYTHELEIYIRPSNAYFTNSFSFEDGDILTLGANPYYDINADVNKSLLSDKLPRFSYRFKYEDNEYSLIAPFTQVAFIPRQDGYFMGDESVIDKDEQSAYKSTIVNFMENKVNQIEFQIDLPEGIAKAKDLEKQLKVKEVEILMKESDGLTIKVVDSIKPFDISQREDNTVQYVFNSAKAIKVLPQEEITRVYDKVPVRAKTQEIIGNRIIYGNFVPYHTAPNELDYFITVGEKKAQAEGLEYFTRREYPNHSLKENRAYQVGIVLCDKFGRQSDVILSKDSTVFYPYRDSSLPLLNANGDIKNIFSGSSLKLTMTSPIPDVYYKDGYPNLYNKDTNPLGWYSYKVVVKQQEQSYYNVYTPTILNGYPRSSGTTPNEDTAHITLFSDNINKIPRDLNEVSDNDETFRADTEIYPRVVTIAQDAGQHTAIKFNNQGVSDSVILIGEKDNMGLNKDIDGGAVSDSPFYSVPNILSAGSNPLIGRISTKRALGAVGVDGNAQTVKYNNTSLNVVETKPQLSNLNIFYETTTAGLITDLNESINQDFGTTKFPMQITPLGYKLSESSAINDDITDNFFPIDYLGNEIINASTVTILESAKDLYGNEFKDRFEIIKNGGNSFKVRNKYDKWVASQDNGFENVLNFTFKISNTSGGKVYTNYITSKNNAIENVNPISITAGADAGGNYNMGSFKEGSPRSTDTSLHGWSSPNLYNSLINQLAILDIQNGSLNREYYQLKVELVSLEFYWNNFNVWSRYDYPSTNPSFHSIDPKYRLNELTALTKLSDNRHLFSLSRYVRALATTTNRPWNKVKYREYPDITSGATSTSYRLKVRATDCNGNWGIKEFYIYFTVDPY